MEHCIQPSVMHMLSIHQGCRSIGHYVENVSRSLSSLVCNLMEELPGHSTVSAYASCCQMHHGDNCLFKHDSTLAHQVCITVQQPHHKTLTLIYSKLWSRAEPH